MSYECGNTFEEITDRFRISKQDSEKIFSILLKQGYTEKGICYAAGKAEQTLLKFIGDSRFNSVFINSVKKYALKSNDPRWNTKRK